MTFFKTGTEFGFTDNNYCTDPKKKVDRADMQ